MRMATDSPTSSTTTKRMIVTEGATIDRNVEIDTIYPDGGPVVRLIGDELGIGDYDILTIEIIAIDCTPPRSPS